MRRRVITITVATTGRGVAEFDPQGCPPPPAQLWVELGARSAVACLRSWLQIAQLRGHMSSASGGVPARVDAAGTLYIAPMTTDHEVLLWILLGAGGGMTYGRWRAERIRARHAMQQTWIKRRDGRGAKTWKLW